MSDIQRRIADILQANVKFACTCGCGIRADCTYGHANHVAGVLVSELGLTREWARRWLGDNNSVNYSGPVDSPDQLPPLSAHVLRVSRYVTEWVPE